MTEQTPDQRASDYAAQQTAMLYTNGGAGGLPPGLIATQQRAMAGMPVIARPAMMPADVTDEERALLEAELKPVLPPQYQNALANQQPMQGSAQPQQQAVVGWGRRGLRVSRVADGAQQKTWTLPEEAKAPLVALLREFGITTIDLTDEGDEIEEARATEAVEWNRASSLPTPGPGAASGADGRLSLRRADVRSGVPDPESDHAPFGGTGGGGPATS